MLFVTAVLGGKKVSCEDEERCITGKYVNIVAAARQDKSAAKKLFEQKGLMASHRITC